MCTTFTTINTFNVAFTNLIYNSFVKFISFFLMFEICDVSLEKLLENENRKKSNFSFYWFSSSLFRYLTIFTEGFKCNFKVFVKFVHIHAHTHQHTHTRTHTYTRTHTQTLVFEDSVKKVVPKFQNSIPTRNKNCRRKKVKKLSPRETFNYIFWIP